jgi:group II intron reverse transcriptase/maturase
VDTATKLRQIAELSQRRHDEVFNNVMHLFNKQSLRECFQELDGRKALGTDGISKDKYKEALENNVEDLLKRMKQMAYRPEAVRQVLIPKEGKPGATRPLGISNFEDKIVQKMMQKVLESIYEPLFKECSHGFRPNKSCHTAIKALEDYLFYNETEAVIDVDISNFFGSIDHEKLLNMLRNKISDQKFIRYVARMFKAGVLADGELVVGDEGVPQGSVCSPVLANVFAHYVIDEWFEEEIKPHKATEMFRYADDIVIVCLRREDAEVVMAALDKRLAEYGLKLSKEKTKRVDFSKKEARKGVQQGSFDFLGFTFYLGLSRKGLVIPKLKTNGKRMRAKLKKVNQWARETRSRVELKEMWKTCCAKLRGHIRYYGVSYNYKQIETFRHEVKRIMFKWINRRSQKASMTWDEFALFETLNPLPKAVIYVKLF